MLQLLQVKAVYLNDVRLLEAKATPLVQPLLLNMKAIQSMIELRLLEVKAIHLIEISVVLPLLTPFSWLMTMINLLFRSMCRCLSCETACHHLAACHLLAGKWPRLTLMIDNLLEVMICCLSCESFCRPRAWMTMRCWLSPRCLHPFLWIVWSPRCLHRLFLFTFILFVILLTSLY